MPVNHIKPAHHSRTGHRTHVVFTEKFNSPDLLSTLCNDQQHSDPKPVLFSDEKYDGMKVSEFIDGPDFKTLKQEYTGLIDGLIDFANSNAEKINPPLSEERLENIKISLLEFKDHLFSSEHFDDHLGIMYGYGKELLHELQNLMNHGSVPLQKKIDTLLDIAPSLPLCSGGVLTALQEGISSLKCAKVGISGAAYRTKVQMIDALILNYVSRTHRYREGDEVHFVNAYFNRIAGELGVGERNDQFTSIATRSMDDIKVQECRDFVFKKISPASITKVMGLNYLNQIRGAQKNKYNEPLKGGEITEAFNQIKDIKAAALDAEYGDVPNDILLMASPDEYSYEIPREPTLLRKHFLKKMRSNDLVAYSGNGVTIADDGKNEKFKILDDIIWKEVDGDLKDLSIHELISVSPKSIVDELDKARIDPEERGGVIRVITQSVAESIERGELKTVNEQWLIDLADLASANKVSTQDIQPALHIAINSSSVNGLKALAKTGIDLDQKDAHGLTPLMIGIERGDTEAVKILAEEGADLEMRNQDDFTALMFAATNRQEEVLQILIDNGAAVNAKCNSGHHDTLMISINYYHEGIFKKLLKAGADVNYCNPVGGGPCAVELAAKLRCMPALDLLIDAKADVFPLATHFFSDDGSFKEDIDNLNIRQIINKINIINKISPHLDKHVQTLLLEKLEDDHSSTFLFFLRVNSESYENLKINHPEVYQAFEEMKANLSKLIWDNLVGWPMRI